MKYPNVRFRLLLSILLAGIVAIALPKWISPSANMLCVGDTGMMCFLLLTWRAMLIATPQIMRNYAQKEDVGRFIILGLVLGSAILSLMALAYLLKTTKGLVGLLLITHLGLSIATILIAWSLVHTIFALHYARGYYRDGNTRLKDYQVNGLTFPNEEEPDYWDFMYFSFIIGMTGQVSDVSITSRTLRKLALFHGVLSFFFNTAILAMSINIIAGLI